MVQGKIAGLAAAGSVIEAARLYRRRDSQVAFGHAMGRAFALRKEILNLAKPETIVCRCEDVRFAQLQTQATPGSWTHAKLQTRCGMGPCQGRVCGPALEFLFGWGPDSVRIPVRPASLASFLEVSHSEKEGAATP